MERFTQINEFKDAVSFLKTQKDSFYPSYTAYDTLPDRNDMYEVLNRANSLWKNSLNESNPRILNEKRMLLD